MAEQKIQKRWYEILRGIHREGEKTYAPDLLERDGAQSPYKDGKYIYTGSQLLKLNPPPGTGPQRFRALLPDEVEIIGLEVPEGETPSDPSDPRIILSKQSIMYLRELAEKEGVDLEGEKRKQVIIDKIISAREKQASVS